MIICVSSMGNVKNSLVDLRFGRCQYFVLYDTEAQLYTAVENKGLESASGAGIAAAQTVIDSKAEVVLTGNLGPNAMSLLKASDIDTVEITGNTVEEAVNAYLNLGGAKIEKAVPAHFGISK